METALHIVSISILLLFEIELCLMMYAYRKAFFVGHGSFWLNMDLIVVTVALVIEVRNTPF